MPSQGWADRGAFIAFCVLALVFPWEGRHPLIAAPGKVDITGIEVLIGVGLGAWLVALARQRRGPRRPAGIALPVTVWIGVLVLATVIAFPHRSEALKFTARTGIGVAVGWAAFDLLGGSTPSPRRWRQMACCLALAGIIVAVIGLAEAVQIDDVEVLLDRFRGGPTRVGDLIRVSSVLVYATIAALVLELTFPFVLVWALTNRRRWLQGILALALVGQSLALVLTLTRAAVLGLLAGLLVLGFGAWRLGNRRAASEVLATGAVLLALVSLLFVVQPTTALRLRSETDAEWYRASYAAPVELAAPAGSVMQTQVALTNNSVRTWLPDGPRRFALSYHLLNEAGELVSYDGPRSALPDSAAPGASVQLTATVVAPATPGRYVLVWDMVQEDVAWFSWKGTPTASTHLEVLPASDADAVLAAPLQASATAPLRMPAPGRLTLWRAALAMVRERPLLGVGPDNFRLTYGPYAGLEVWSTSIHTNNMYIEWLAGTGITGLAVFLWLTLRLLRVWLQAQNGWRRVDLTMALWHLAALAALTSWFTHGLFDSFYEFTSTFVLFWLVAALAAAAPAPDEQVRTSGPG